MTPRTGGKGRLTNQSQGFVNLSQVRILVAALVLASATAHSPNPTEHGPDNLGSAQTFRCEPVWASDNPVVASDPTCKVIVRIEFKRGSEMASDLFVHRSGAKDNSADRYVRSNLTTRPGHRDYNWYGTNPTDPNIVMHRELVEKDSPQYGKNTWFYIEERYKYGEKDSEYRAVCRKTDPDANE